MPPLSDFAIKTNVFLMIFVFALSSFWLHFGSIFGTKMGKTFVPECHFFHLFALGSQTGPQGRPRHQNGAKKRAQASQKMPKSHPKGRLWGPKCPPGRPGHPKRRRKVVTEFKSSQKSSKREAQRPTFTQKTSQKSSQTMKHGSGTGVSHWIIYNI